VPLCRTAALVAAVLLCGCETLAYYAQAVGGQVSLMSRAQPVDGLLADPQTPQDLRARLILAREIRAYAVKELKLPDNPSYRSYADIGRPYAVWNVVAAPEFSLEPMQSCFPVAGCVSYRGFFARTPSATRRACARRVTTLTSTAWPRTRRSGNSTTRCYRASSASRMPPWRGSCSTNSRTRWPT
jgi:predicted aminopeptidase